MEQPQNTPAVETEVSTLANTLGLSLDTTQLHIGGERALMSPNKYVLTGTYKADNRKIIFKCATHPQGKQEIKEEHHIQTILHGLPFTEQELLMPEEILYGTKGNFVYSVTYFIQQDAVFTDYTIQQQFFMALHAMECQESFHATTKEHQTALRKQFHANTPDFYIESYAHLVQNIKNVWDKSTSSLDQGMRTLEEGKETLNTYDRYLMHTDFVPHNFRITKNQLYLLDFSSFKIGNKYESWARFINFMEVHSPQLVPLLLTYIQKDRGSDQYKSLQLMRIYKVCFLLEYHARIMQNTTGDLHQLSIHRLHFWTHVLDAIITDSPVDQSIRTEYYHHRSALRTEKEKKRQALFTWA